MINEEKNYLELAQKFIDEHNSNDNWSPFDRLEKVAIIMYAKWLENKQSSLENKEILSNNR